jgi:Trk-type K+ transport system membrane component
MSAGDASWLPSIGWVATAVFTASYFTTRAERLRYLQMLGAALWLVYGIAIGAPPVIVANLLVLGAATWTTVRATTRRPRPAGRPR